MVLPALPLWKVRRVLRPSLQYALDFLLIFYFKLVAFTFELINYFIPRRVVPPITNDLLNLSATKAAYMIRERELTSSELVEAYIGRLKEVQPIIHAVVYDNYEEALGQAENIDKLINSMDDEELRKYCETRPLLGLPFTMKDSIKAAGKHLSVGIVAWKDYIADENAVVVQRLFDSGAILLAQTNVPQCALWVETNNVLHGRSNNPYDSRRTVGGSSGGEGAVHGAGASLIGVGSDMGGSIRIPSFYNGIFGFVPTPGVVSSEGHVPLAQEGSYKSEMGRIGPLTRFGQDLPLLLQVLAGNKEPFPRISMKKVKIFYSRGLESCTLTEPLNRTEENALYLAVRHLENACGTVAHQIKFESMKDHVPYFFVSIRESDEEPTLNRWLNSPLADGEPVNCWLELLKFARGKSDHVLVLILQGLVDKNPMFSQDQRNELVKSRDELRRGIIELLGENGVLLWPGQPKEVPYHNELMFKQSTIGYTAIWNTLRLPVVQCPMGLSKDGLPTGIQVIGAPGSDGLLLQVAQEIGDKFGGWIAPR